MLILILIIAFFVLLKVYKFIQKKQQQEELLKRNERERQEHNKRIEVLMSTQFFKTVKEQLLEVNKKAIIDLLKSGNNVDASSLPFICITQSAINVNQSVILPENYDRQFNISYYALGYRALNNQERNDLENAILCMGYETNPYDDSQTPLLHPQEQYWKPVIENTIANYNMNFKSIY